MTDRKEAENEVEVTLAPHTLHYWVLRWCEVARGLMSVWTDSGAGSEAYRDDLHARGAMLFYARGAKYFEAIAQNLASGHYEPAGALCRPLIDQTELLAYHIHMVESGDPYDPDATSREKVVKLLESKSYYGSERASQEAKWYRRHLNRMLHEGYLDIYAARTPRGWGIQLGYPQSDEHTLQACFDVLYAGAIHLNARVELSRFLRQAQRADAAETLMIDGHTEIAVNLRKAIGRVMGEQGWGERFEPEKEGRRAPDDP